jgi:hypothetical protein
VRKEHLQRCQVATPQKVVNLLWAMALQKRPGVSKGRVLDLGAGDARFAFSGKYREYVGLEIDASKLPSSALPVGARVEKVDAMLWKDADFDLCIGNPPYVRHHNLDGEWRTKVLKRIYKEASLSIKETANAFVLFLAQALLRTKSDALVVQLVPFEWVSRPSAAELREYIRSQGWSVTVCRFKDAVFSRVLTTASITIIDKRKRDGSWEFFEIDQAGKLVALRNATGKKAVLAYERKPESIYARRGLSPGGQDIFVLTEQERLFFQAT